MLCFTLLRNFLEETLQMQKIYAKIKINVYWFQLNFEHHISWISLIVLKNVLKTQLSRRSLICTVYVCLELNITQIADVIHSHFSSRELVVENVIFIVDFVCFLFYSKCIS